MLSFVPTDELMVQKSGLLTQHLRHLLLSQNTEALAFIGKDGILSLHPSAETAFQLSAEVQGAELVGFLLCRHISLLGELFVF